MMGVGCESTQYAATHLKMHTAIQLRSAGACFRTRDLLRAQADANDVNIHASGLEEPRDVTCGATHTTPIIQDTHHAVRGRRGSLLCPCSGDATKRQGLVNHVNLRLLVGLHVGLAVSAVPPMVHVFPPHALPQGRCGVVELGDAGEQARRRRICAAAAERDAQRQRDQQRRKAAGCVHQPHSKGQEINHDGAATRGDEQGGCSPQQQQQQQHYWQRTAV